MPTDLLLLARALGTIVAVWLALGLLLVGLGRGVLWMAIGRIALRRTSWDVSACTGYAVLIGFLMLAHLVAPINGAVLAVVSAMSIIGWIATRKRNSERDTTAPPLPWSIRLSLLVGALWVANRAIGPCVSYDAAHYQLSLVRWYHSYPTVPGLANLSPPLGLNLSGLLFNALLEVGPGFGRSSHFINGFLLVLLGAVLLRRIAPSLRSGAQGIAPAAAASVVLLFPTLWQAGAHGGLWVTSPATDLPPLFASAVALVLAIEVLTTRDHSGPATLDSRSFAALAMTATLPALKATALCYGLVSFAVWAWLFLSASPRRPRPTRAVLAATVFAAVLGVAWLARSVILTGYLLLPASWVLFDVPWRLPLEYVEGLYWWAHSYSRTPGDFQRMLSDRGGLSWLRYWWSVEGRSALSEMLVPLAIAFGGTFACADRRPGPTGLPFRALAAVAVSLPVWFFTAPLVRYGQFLFWCLAATIIALAADRNVAARGRVARRLLIAASLAMALAPAAIQTWYALRERRTPAQLMRDILWTPPGSDSGFHATFEVPLRTVLRCNGSFPIYVPAADIALSNGPWRETLPWYSPLPAATFPLPEVCPRDPEDLGSGFLVRAGPGDWSARHAEVVRLVRDQSGLDEARLAIHFGVRPELIRRSLADQKP
jgi:hypothetical protein